MDIISVILARNHSGDFDLPVVKISTMLAIDGSDTQLTEAESDALTQAAADGLPVVIDCLINQGDGNGVPFSLTCNNFAKGLQLVTIAAISTAMATISFTRFETGWTASVRVA